MRKRLHKSYSILKKLWVPMVLVLLIQSAVFAGTILFGGPIDNLRQNSFDMLTQQTQSRRDDLMNNFVGQWSNFEEFESTVQSVVSDFLSQKHLTYQEIGGNDRTTNELLDRLAENMIPILRKGTTTGAFVIFNCDGSPTSYIKAGVHIRDLDPLTNPSDTSDLMLERGPSSISQKLGISLDATWHLRYNFYKYGHGISDLHFYYNPYLAAKTYPRSNYQDLGYWSLPFHLDADDLNIVTYTVPLMDATGQPYGVIGIELTVDYLSSFLPYDELNMDGRGAYLLCMAPRGTMDFHPVAFNGPMYQHYGSGRDSILSMTSKPILDSVYAVKGQNGAAQDIYGAVENLQLYNPNTPFENDQWALIGLTGKNDLLAAVHRVKSSLLVALLITITIGLTVLFFTGVWITRPILSLVEKVRKSDPYKPVSLEKTNIREIDEISSAVELLSLNVADSASRLSRIIDLVNLPIGAFEYQADDKSVYCTPGLFKILNLKEPPGDNKLMDYHQFKKILKQLRKNPEPNLDHTYLILDANDVPKWVRLEQVDEDQRMLGIIMDVTEETIEKRKIEYERDYDLLTQLLNRRAYHRYVREILNSGKIKQAAFIMWDLDNLKYINDHYGHDIGDEYIKKAAFVLQRFSTKGAFVSRISGDEFYVFLYGAGVREALFETIHQIHQELLRSYLILPDGSKIKMRASAGIAWYPDDSAEFDLLMRYADFAMYSVKTTNKGSINEFDKSTYLRDRFLINSTEDLNRLIEEELIEYAFQPIIDARSGEIFAFEALMRPQIQALSSPADVLRLAQAQSKLYQIERLTIFKAMRTFVALLDQFDDAKLFINSIPNQVLSVEDNAEFIALYGQYTSRLVVELLENERTNKNINQKKQNLIDTWHAETALDDFGAGYNNDIILLSLNPEYVKIDMSIIRNIDIDVNRWNLLKNVMEYVKGRNIKIIAEGVETKSEMETLLALGIDYLQGYYLGKPALLPQKIPAYVTEEIRMIHLKYETGQKEKNHER